MTASFATNTQRGRATTALQELDASLALQEAWLVDKRFLGNDPHDALRSPLLGALTFNNRYLGIAWVQLLRRSPVDLRRLLGVKPGYNPKGMGLFLASYVRRYRTTGSEEDRARIDFFSDWLRRNRSSGYEEACWGYNFDWPNRSFFAPAGTPTIVNTSFIAQAFLDRHELLGEGGDLEIARSACDFLLRRLVRIEGTPGHCFSYTPLDRRRVHNANMLGAALLARVGRLMRDSELINQAREAVRYTMARQREDGSWPYGEGGREAWVDNFHTGFVLESLLQYMRESGDAQFEEGLERGYRYWKGTFFAAAGEPKFYAHRLYPIDAHAAAQAILTFLAFSGRDPEAAGRALQLATWTIANLQDRAGYFYYQIGRFFRNRIPYIRWSQAWMFRALTECCVAASTNTEVFKEQRVNVT